MGRYGQPVAATPAAGPLPRGPAARPVARSGGKPPAHAQAAARRAAADLAAADMAPPAPHGVSIGAAARIGRADAARIAAQLAVMLDAGVPLTQAIEGLQSTSDKPHVREGLQAVLADLRNGSDLSGAIARCPCAFPPIVPKLLRAAEAAGSMGSILARISDYLQTEVETVRKVRGALAYPMVMMGLAVVAMAVIFGFLLPRFEVMYAGRQAMLPAPTRLALSLSHFLREHWIAIVSAAGSGVAAVVLYLRCARGRITMDWLKLHTPLINRMFRQFYVARSFQTIGTMIAAGLTVPEAVRLSRDVTGNSYFTRLWDLAQARLEAGQRLADPLFASPLVSRTVAQLVATGERSGNLAAVMGQIAAMCEKDLQHTIKTVTGLLEPLMIVILGGMVGSIVMAILLPVFRIAKLVSGGG